MKKLVLCVGLISIGVFAADAKKHRPSHVRRQSICAPQPKKPVPQYTATHPVVSQFEDIVKIRENAMPKNLQ